MLSHKSVKKNAEKIADLIERHGDPVTAYIMTNNMSARELIAFMQFSEYVFEQITINYDSDEMNGGEGIFHAAVTAKRINDTLAAYRMGV